MSVSNKTHQPESDEQEARLHAQQCFANGLTGGNCDVFQARVASLGPASSEYDFVITQTIAMSLVSGFEIEQMVTLIELSVATSFVSVRQNAAILARRLMTLRPLMNVSLSTKFDHSVNLIQFDSDKSVRTNLNPSSQGNQSQLEV